MEESEGDAGRTRVVRDECAKVLRSEDELTNCLTLLSMEDYREGVEIAIEQPDSAFTEKREGVGSIRAYINYYKREDSPYQRNFLAFILPNSSLFEIFSSILSNSNLPFARPLPPRIQL